MAPNRRTARWAAAGLLLAAALVAGWLWLDAFDRLDRGDVRYRFVLDLSDLDS